MGESGTDIRAVMGLCSFLRPPALGNIIYLFIVGMLSLRCWAGFVPVRASKATLVAWWCMDFPLWRLPSLKTTGPGRMAHRLSCPAACGIFLNQGLDLCLLPHRVDA